MAQNETIVAALARDPTPANRECIKTLTDVLKGVEEFMKIVGLASSSGSPFPTSNNVAAQAKETADSALAIAQALQAAAQQRRSSSSNIPLSAGDSTSPITWSPAMPSTNYEVRITPYGTNSNNPFSWHVVEGTKDFSSVQVRFVNAPASTSFAWVVEQL